MLKKEFIIMIRDKRTYLFLILIPLLQVILFGFIINTDAKHLSTIIVTQDRSPFISNIIYALSSSEYFKITSIESDSVKANQLMQSGKVQFIITIPQNFTRDLITHKQPTILIEGDGTNPMVVSNAFAAAKIMAPQIMSSTNVATPNSLGDKKPAFLIHTQSKYNPAAKAQYHTLPGLIVSIITISLTMLTAISITTEYEEGTMESLLITPIYPLEVILGKIIPNLIIAYILFYLTILIAVFMFNVPFYGSLTLLSVVALPFFIANLGIGIVTSSLSKTQFQAANIASTYALPAVLFSGFMFPFAAMPSWAQWVGNLLPPTHFLRITSDVMLKDANLNAVLPNLWPILIFIVIIMFIAVKFYRRTLD